jgi:EmrB/QacA subfamily drug resistance transporter
MPPSSPAAPSPGHDRHPGWVLGALVLAGTAFALAQTLVVPALPAVQREFGTDASTAAWLLTGFLLSASVATPVVGKLGDLHGRGRTLAAVLAIFAMGSVICALASSIGTLIAGRVVQGVAGGVFPLAFGIIRDTFPPRRVAAAIGGVSATFGIGGGFGLVLAGIIVDNLDLSWLFWIGLLVLPAAALALWAVPDRPAGGAARIDWAGASVLAAGLVALLLGISRANEWGWGSTRVIVLVAAGLALLVAWVPVELRVAEPLVDMRLLRRRPVLMTNVTALLVGFAMFASFLLVPQFVETPARAGYGFSASVTTAGFFMLPSSLVMLFAGPLAALLAGRISSRAPLVVGTVAAVASFSLLAAAHEERWQILVAVALLGAGLGFAFASMANLVVESVPRDQVGVATGINSIMRTVGGAIGGAIATAVVTATTIPGTLLPVESGYTDAFLLSAGGAVVALLATLAIPPRRGGQEAPAGSQAPAAARA